MESFGYLGVDRQFCKKERCWDVGKKAVMAFVLLSVSIFADFDFVGVQISGVVICYLGWEGDSKSLSNRCQVRGRDQYACRVQPVCKQGCREKHHLLRSKVG